MGKVLGPLSFMAMGLVCSILSLTQIKKGATYPFDFPQPVPSPCTNYFDTYLVPMMISFPNVHESEGFKSWRFFTQLYIGEYL